MKIIILSSLTLLLSSFAQAQSVPTEQARTQNTKQFLRFPDFQNIEIVTEKKDQSEPLVELIQDNQWKEFVKKMRWLDIRALDIDLTGIKPSSDGMTIPIVFGVFHKFNSSASGTMNVRGSIVIRRSDINDLSLQNFSDSQSLESLLRRGAFGLWLSGDELDSKTLELLNGAVKPVLRNYLNNNRTALLKALEPKLNPQR